MPAFNSPATGSVLVGHDVSVYTVTAGATGDPSVFTAGVTYTFLGIFKTITIELMEEWEEVTSSAAELKERRKLVSDWRATLEIQTRFGNNYSGSFGTELIGIADYVYIVFTEIAGGRTFQLWGGIEKNSYKRDRGEGTETVDIINVGDIANQGFSIAYG